MLAKAIKGAAVLIICGIAMYFIFGATNIKIDATAEKVGQDIVINYSIDNKSIAPLTLYKDNKEETFLEVTVYNSNKRPIRIGLENPTGEHLQPYLGTKKEAAAGGNASTFKTTYPLDTSKYNGRINEALYVKLSLRVNKDHIEDPFERFISFLRRGRVSSDLILIN